jgi:hypothetical protein
MFTMTIEIADGEYGNPIPMREMEPCQIAIIDDTEWNGYIVMRTESLDKFEVMNLSHPWPGGCWDDGSAMLVRPLPKGSKITLEVMP